MESKEKLGKELLEALENAVNKLIEKKAEDLIERNHDTYFKGYDKDFVDIGVGSVCVRCDEIYDEERAREDAEEKVIEELVNNEEDAAFELFENEAFRNALGKFLKGK